METIKIKATRWAKEEAKRRAKHFGVTPEQVLREIAQEHERTGGITIQKWEVESWFGAHCGAGSE